MELGLCINEEHVFVSVVGEDKVIDYPFSIAKNESSFDWYIGEDVYLKGQENGVIIIDKLLKMVEDNRTATIINTKYTAKDLLTYYFKNLFLKYGYVDYVTVVVNNPKIVIMEALDKVLLTILENKDSYKVTTYSEAFSQYLTTFSEDIYNDRVGLIEFSNNFVSYFELERYATNDEKEFWKVNASTYYEIPIDLLYGEKGIEVCDKLLTEFAVKNIKDKNDTMKTYSKFFLAGLGFLDNSKYRDFMNYICDVCDVVDDVYFFAKAASAISKKIVNKQTDDDKIFINDARTKVLVSLNATINQENVMIDMVEPGDEWFYVDCSFNVILDESKEILFTIYDVETGETREEPFRIDDGFHLRDNKTNMLNCSIKFLSQNAMTINVEEMGFGDFYEATNAHRPKTIYL